MIFNYLGSNYPDKFAWRFLTAGRNPRADLELRETLARHYDGRVFLYYRGRAALSEAVRLCRTDFVLVNGFTCYVVEEAVQGVNGQSVFADTDPETYNFNLQELKKIHQKQPAIGAVVIQNTFGIGPAIKEITAYCKKHRLLLIEDLAHCPDNSYADGPRFGQVGDLVVLSFGDLKQIDVVAGGALIVRNRDLLKDVLPTRPLKRHYRRRLTERFYPLISRKLRYLYRWPRLAAAKHGLLLRLGLLWRASDGGLFKNVALPPGRAAFILEQWQNLESDKKRRQKLMGIYDRILQSDNPLLKQQALVRYPLLLPSLQIRNLLLPYLAEKGFPLKDHWYDSLVYPSRFAKFSDYEEGNCPQKEDISRQIINLPLHRNISPEQATRLAELVRPFQDLSLKEDYDSQSWLEDWQAFAPEQRNLLTSWPETEAYRQLGHKVYRFGLYCKQRPVALVAAVVIEARRGRFLRVPGGPLLNPEYAESWPLVMDRLKQIARLERCLCVRLQAFLPDNAGNRQLMANLGLREAPLNANAPHTLKIDLEQPYEQILASKAYRNTRNHINRARRLKLRIVEKNTAEGLEEFLKLLRTTARNQGFTPNKSDFIEAQFESYGRAGQLRLYLVLNSAEAEQPEEVLAGALIIDQGSESAYLYGASSSAGQDLRAPYLLQAHAIAEAQKRGMKTYNLWGAAPPQASPKHHFSGLTAFKRCFSKNLCSYLPGYDLILNRKAYLLLYLLESYERRKKRL